MAFCPTLFFCNLIDPLILVFPQRVGFSSLQLIFLAFVSTLHISLKYAQNQRYRTKTNILTKSFIYHSWLFSHTHIASLNKSFWFYFWCLCQTLLTALLLPLFQATIIFCLGSCSSFPVILTSMLVFTGQQEQFFENVSQHTVLQ